MQNDLDAAKNFNYYDLRTLKKNISSLQNDIQLLKKQIDNP
jgi:hypothetical protein